jgi:hypothetical protein
VKRRELKFRESVESVVSLNEPGDDEKDMDGRVVNGIWVGSIQIDVDDVEYLPEVWRNRCGRKPKFVFVGYSRLQNADDCPTVAGATFESSTFRNEQLQVVDEFARGIARVDVSAEIDSQGL